MNPSQKSKFVVVVDWNTFNPLTTEFSQFSTSHTVKNRDHPVLVGNEIYFRVAVHSLYERPFPIWETVEIDNFSSVGTVLKIAFGFGALYVNLAKAYDFFFFLIFSFSKKQERQYKNYINNLLIEKEREKKIIHWCQ